MFVFHDSSLSRLCVHHVGNRQKEEKLVVSESPVEMDEFLQDLLHAYFLGSFKTEAYYSFTDESDLQLNEVFNLVSKIFENPEQIHESSIHLAKHLFDKSTHPKVEAGEFYVAHFQDCVIDDEFCDAIGLFKTESKDTFLKVVPQQTNFAIQYDSGVNLNKLDKGCLIFNTEKDLGYKVLIVDKKSKSEEAVYWRDDFLKLKQREDNFYHTQNYLKACKGFVEEVFNEENDVERADQIDMLNKSINYFSGKDEFNKEEFEQDVMMGEQQVVEAFNNYKQQLAEKDGLGFDEDFEISKDAVKSQKRVFKSVLKLDKNFHVYIHGDRTKIIRGKDPQTGMNFYQLFYEQEQ